LLSKNLSENCSTGRSEGCREHAALHGLVANWQRLTPEVWAAIVVLVRAEYRGDEAIVPGPVPELALAWVRVV
jgi:hypothetical protein